MANKARFADGSLPVYAVGEQLVLKLYPPVAPSVSWVHLGPLEPGASDPP